MLPRAIGVALVVWGVGLFAAGPADAQWPGVIEGQIVDRETGRPVAFASVALMTMGAETSAGTDGRFRLAAVTEGRHELRVDRLGYGAVTKIVQVRHGRVERVTIALAPKPIDVEAMSVRVEARDRWRIERREIVDSGALTVGEVLDRVPGVVVRRRGVGGTETVSLRGSSGDGVLVLLDGIPLNDPVTGEADLSLVPAAGVETVTVHLGARSAEFGSRARAGAVVIESRTSGSGSEARIGAGSLGAAHIAVESGAGSDQGGWRLLAEHRTVGGEFSFRLPESVGSLEGRRQNADRRRTHASAAIDSRLSGGRLGLRAGLDFGDRGLPGKAFAPAVDARQEMVRGRVAGTWSRGGDVGEESIAAYATGQTIRHRDPAPPIGLEYDDRSRIGEFGMRATTSRRIDVGPFQEWIARGDVRRRAIDIDALGSSAKRSFTDVGLGAAVTLAPNAWRGRGVEANARVGFDRDDVTDRWFATYGIDASVNVGALRVEAAHRTGYAPPSLGDLFFDAAIGVEPNPDLRPERTSGELELGAVVTDLAGLGLDAGLSAYRADVRDLIEWAPDFRFVWSPRNFDVRRRGAEAWLSFESLERGLRLDASFAYARVTYAPHEDRGRAQIVYRPRRWARVALEWRRAAWTLGAESIYTGRRNTAPTEFNALSGFWTLDLRVSRQWSLGALEADTAMWIERATGQTNALIFGFPDAGRRVRFELRLRRAISDRFSFNSPEKGDEDDEA